MECAEHGFFEEETGQCCPICSQVMASENQPVLFVDGAGWNGKVSRWCYVDHEQKKRIVVLEDNFTNNEMEYAALLAALMVAPDGSMIRTDSQLVEGQVSKGWKINAENLGPLADLAKRQVLEKRITLVWVRREFNLAGQHLEATKGVQ